MLHETILQWFINEIVFIHVARDNSYATLLRVDVLSNQNRTTMSVLEISLEIFYTLPQQNDLMNIERHLISRWKSSSNVYTFNQSATMVCQGKTQIEQYIPWTFRFFRESRF